MDYQWHPRTHDIGKHARFKQRGQSVIVRGSNRLAPGHRLFFTDHTATVGSEVMRSTGAWVAG